MRGKCANTLKFIAYSDNYVSLGKEDIDVFPYSHDHVSLLPKHIGALSYSHIYVSSSSNYSPVPTIEKRKEESPWRVNGI